MKKGTGNQKFTDNNSMKSREKSISFYPYIILFFAILGVGAGLYSVKEDLMKQMLIKNNARNNRINLEENKRNLITKQHADSIKCQNLQIELRSITSENEKLRKQIDDLIKEEQDLKDGFINFENEENLLKENIKKILNQKEIIENEYQSIFENYTKTKEEYKKKNNNPIIKNSEIIDTETDLNILKSFINNKTIELCYSSKVDGFNSLTFHKKCDEKQKTLTLYETNYFERFGGYTEKKWNGKDGDIDNKSFVFNLEEGKKFNFVKNDKGDNKSIFPNEINYPSFGGFEKDYDIIVGDSEKPNIAQGYSKFPTSYKQNEKSDVLCHRDYFEIINIEVYSVRD